MQYDTSSPVCSTLIHQCFIVQNLLTHPVNSLPLHTVAITLQHANIGLSTPRYALAEQQGFEGNGHVILSLLSQAKGAFTMKNLINFLYSTAF